MWALAAIVAYTGVRLGEALFLRIEDVELDRRIFRIHPRRRYKTERSASRVPIPPELLAVLAVWIPRAAERGPWLFPSSRVDRPWTSGGPGRKPTARLKADALAVGVEGFTFASLRHTFATWSRRRWGLTALELRDVLRHETTETQEHYLHPDDSLEGLVRSVDRVSYFG